jgi:hypothetical protein
LKSILERTGSGFESELRYRRWLAWWNTFRLFGRFFRADSEIVRIRWRFRRVLPRRIRGLVVVEGRRLTMATADRKSLFVAMPFKPEYESVLETIREAADLLGMETVQIGDESFTGSIASQIRSAIEAAEVMTAIVTEDNGNVYYEIGLAHCQEKPVVLLTSNPDTIKFDLRDHRAIVYDPRRPRAIRDEIGAYNRFGTPGER